MERDLIIKLGMDRSKATAEARRFGEEAKAIFQKFHAMVTGAEVNETGPDLGKLEVFSGVCQYPVRVKCATLAWHTLDAAMSRPGGTISTEDTSAKSSSDGD